VLAQDEPIVVIPVYGEAAAPEPAEGKGLILGLGDVGSILYEPRSFPWYRQILQG